MAVQEDGRDGEEGENGGYEKVAQLVR